MVPAIQQAPNSPSDNGTVIINVSNSPDVQEGSANAAAVFTVTLSQARKSTTVTVDYSTANGSAGAGFDYAAKSGRLTFQPGETSKTVSVKVLNDSPDGHTRETFFLNLSNPSNPGAKAKIGSGTGQAVIVQPRTLPQLNVHSTTTSEGHTNHTIFVQVTLSQATNQNVTFLANTLSGTAAAHGVDYHGFSSTSFTIKAGQTSVSIPIQITGASNADEGSENGKSESFLVQVTQVTSSNAAIGNGQATVTLFP